MLRRSTPLMGLLLLLFTFTTHAFDAKVKVLPMELSDLPGFTPVSFADLPDFKSEIESKATKSGKVHTNGLLATINYMEFPKRQPDVQEEKIILEPSETGFPKPIEVRGFFQDHKAPLAVTLLGFSEDSSDRLARAWQTYLYKSGCHVLSFDSLIRNNMNEAAGYGVAGYIVEESVVVGKIVDAFLAKTRKKGGKIGDQVSSVRLLGTSYGGLLSMECLRLPQAKTWPIDRALIVSIPINMTTTAKRLDTFDREDKPFFGIFKLLKLLGGYTPKGDQPTPDEESLFRAGIGYVFHGDLTGLAKSNVDRYDPELLTRLSAWDEKPEQKDLNKTMLTNLKNKQEEELKELEGKKGQISNEEFEKQRTELKAKHKVQEIVAKRKPSDLNTWDFQDYVFLLLKPYWKMKRGGGVSVTLQDLMLGAPNFVQVVIAADDPLNEPSELEVTKSKIPEPKLLVVPHGGHLGFTGTKWCESLVEKLFKAQ